MNLLKKIAKRYILYCAGMWQQEAKENEFKGPGVGLGVNAAGPDSETLSLADRSLLVAKAMKIHVGGIS
jgi:hypothetical protein